MDIDADALKERLKTGVVGEDFAPADKGYATSFASVFAYNLTRFAAIDKIKAAHAATVAELRPKIDDYDTKRDVITTMKAAGENLARRSEI